MKLTIQVTVDFSEALYRDMVERRLSIIDYSDFLGVSRDTISRILNNKGTITEQTVKRIEVKTGLKLLPEQIKIERESD